MAILPLRRTQQMLLDHGESGRRRVRLKFPHDEQPEAVRDLLDRDGVNGCGLSMFDHFPAQMSTPDGAAIA